MKGCQYDYVVIGDIEDFDTDNFKFNSNEVGYLDWLSIFSGPCKQSYELWSLLIH